MVVLVVTVVVVVAVAGVGVVVRGVVVCPNYVQVVRVCARV